MRERQKLDSAVSFVRGVDRDLSDNLELIELGEAEDDADVVGEAEKAIFRLSEDMAKRQLETLLSGEADANSSFSLHRKNASERRDDERRIPLDHGFQGRPRLP